MIVDLPSTTTTEISKRLVALRHAVGAMAMGRVLTLLLITDEDEADAALEVANDATRQHPARILAVVRANRRGASRLDAQIRVGGDAGASEIVILRLFGEMADHGASVVTPLLLPDSPIVAWWPGEPPTDVATSALGAIARRRITDAGACAKPSTQLKRRAKTYAEGDTDLSWTRITRWRGLLAAALDEAPFAAVQSAVVVAEAGEPSADLIAGWLAHALDVPVQRVNSAAGSGIVSIRMDREDGPIDLVRAREGLSTLSQPGRPVREVPLSIPSPAECLAAELRRLDADEIYAAALTEGLPQVTRRSKGAANAARAGDIAPGPADVPSSSTPSMSSRSLKRRSPKESAPPAKQLQQRVEEELAEVSAGEVRTAADPDALAADVAAAIASALKDAVALRGTAHLVLTGGSMGARTVTALASAHLPKATWSKVHIWWGDERFVPQGHQDRNDQQARDAGLERLPVPSANIHPAPAGSSEDELPAAVAEWASELAAHAIEGEHAPRFDVVLLGVGPDAHVASLFPDRSEVTVTDRTTVLVTASPKPPPLRLSLTVPAINAAERVWLVVAGADKAEAVAAARDARDDPHLPASWVRGTRETVWWLDEAAAGD
ncbi:6-phosphogluconolactonase [Ornithinimicrobium faecis]|uniref:6-phosphogluconolactonase n=1 Tax=Ornithinimicrobium faecis TaxID=2934158 RepID=A0ABY4YNY8_9MICO|nr:6-phosphogluconolactonase [Ornithinimicrobium sp. HY1793]USQ78276.1 6-phosphogluconolactonase [Ornithinimicrobium sp. HY1793]